MIPCSRSCFPSWFFMVISTQILFFPNKVLIHNPARLLSYKSIFPVAGCKSHHYQFACVCARTLVSDASVHAEKHPVWVGGASSLRYQFADPGKTGSNPPLNLSITKLSAIFLFIIYIFLHFLFHAFIISSGVLALWRKRPVKCQNPDRLHAKLFSRDRLKDWCN